MTAGGSQKSTEDGTSGTLSAYDEFVARTKNIFFVRDSLASVEAQMADDLATPYSRVGAWCRRNAWGRLRFWCMNEDGTAARQKDCASALRLHKGTVSKAFALLEARGVIEIRDNRIFPILEPGLKPVTDPDKEDAWSSFIEQWWRPHNPDLARQLDEADDLEGQANAIRKRVRAIRRDVAVLQKRDYETFTKTGEPPAQPSLPGALGVAGERPEVAGEQPETVFPAPQPPVSGEASEELPTPKCTSLLVLDVKDGRDGKNGHTAAVAVTQDETVELEAAYERHLKHHRDEPKEVVLGVVRGMAASGRFDWVRFRDHHFAWCRYQERKGWQYCNLSFLAWIRAGMPPPPPEPVTREQERGQGQLLLARMIRQS